MGKKHVEVFNRSRSCGVGRARTWRGRTRSDGIAKRQRARLLELLLPVRKLLSRDSLGFLVPVLSAAANHRQDFFDLLQPAVEIGFDTAGVRMLRTVPQNELVVFDFAFDRIHERVRRVAVLKERGLTGKRNSDDDFRTLHQVRTSTGNDRPVRVAAHVDFDLLGRQLHRLVTVQHGDVETEIVNDCGKNLVDRPCSEFFGINRIDR